MNPLPTLPTVLTLAKMIDHSLLHPTMTDPQLDAGCALAVRFETATVCVKPYYVARAAELVRGTSVQVCSVINFPHGNSHTVMKVREAELAIREGALEIDMVANAGKVLGGDLRYVADDIKQVNDACVANGAILKVIFENDFLSDPEIISLCRICSDIGVAFVKTSTGYGFVKQANGDYNYRGATDAHLKLMRAQCSERVQLKAAGGVRTLEDLLRVRALGVTRVGATATQSILTAALKRGLSAGSAKLEALAPSDGAATDPSGY
ncbi:deoxyribose-phosphate aldolase [mine drainage metagenome]|uniref:deoxyribose-phosphate aldolase n=1 Tax=mine drainage metagenome TaxID=410659 RepID=A0A1J5R294_9ZZZZ